MRHAGTQRRDCQMRRRRRNGGRLLHGPADTLTPFPSSKAATVPLYSELQKLLLVLRIAGSAGSLKTASSRAEFDQLSLSFFGEFYLNGKNETASGATPTT